MICGFSLRRELITGILGVAQCIAVDGRERREMPHKSETGIKEKTLWVHGMQPAEHTQLGPNILNTA